MIRLPDAQVDRSKVSTPSSRSSLRSPASTQGHWKERRLTPCSSSPSSLTISSGLEHEVALMSGRGRQTVASVRPPEYGTPSRPRKRLFLKDLNLGSTPTSQIPLTPTTRASTPADVPDVTVSSLREQSLPRRNTPSQTLGALARKSSKCQVGSNVPTPDAMHSSSQPFPTPSHAGRGWRRGEQIGAGSYGSVYKAQDKATGEVFAVKISEPDSQGGTVSESHQRELSICKRLRHRNIVSYLGHEQVERSLYIYLEYVAGGSLRDMLKEFGPLDDSLIPQASRGILEGLNYLHSHEPPVVHRDLKGSNVLVDLSFCFKLADFGCAKCDLNTQSFKTYGSIPWMAPEVVQGGHGRKADIWSFGCVFIEMSTADDPWGPGAFKNLMHAMMVIGRSDRTPPIPDGLSQMSRSFISQCLQRDPQERPSAAEMLEHEFIRDVLQ